MDFDDQKGMFQVKSKLTTKQVSSNPGRMRLIQEAKSSLEKQLADLGIKLRQEWEAGHPDDQPELPFDEIGDSAAAFDLSRNGVAVTAEGPARRRSNAKQVAMPEGENE